MSETVSAPPIALAGTANGVAHDPVADCLWVVHDTGELVAYDRSGTIRSGGTPLPANADQCVIADRRYGDIMTGELLVTAGANGAAGTIHRWGPSIAIAGSIMADGSWSRSIRWTVRTRSKACGSTMTASGSGTTAQRTRERRN